MHRPRSPRRNRRQAHRLSADQSPSATPGTDSHAGRSQAWCDAKWTATGTGAPSWCIACTLHESTADGTLQRIMVVRHLLLSLGDKKCRLTASELQRYPDTLLGNIAGGIAIGSTDALEMEAGGTGTTESSDEGTIGVSLDKLAGSPFAEWPQALDVVAALYRDNCIPIHLLEQMLGDEMPAADNNKDNSKVHLRVYSRLKSLLAFMGFDGPVTRWLPITKMDFSNHGARQITYACIACEAAQLIFSHKPYADASANFKWTNVAAFLVTLGSQQTNLDVCLVEVNCTDDLRAAVKLEPDGHQKINTAWGTSLVVTSSNRGSLTLCLGASTVQPLPAANHKQASLVSESAASLVSTAIGPCTVASQKFPECISRYFAQALEALKPPDLNIAACSVICHQRQPLYRNHTTVMLPLWVVHW